MIPILAAATLLPMPAPPVAVHWIIEPVKPVNEAPQTKLFLAVGSKKTFIAKVGEDLTLIQPSEYHDCHVPRFAITACHGWYAGGGDAFYVIKKGSRYRVYQQPQDEQSPIMRFKLVKSVR